MKLILQKAAKSIRRLIKDFKPLEQHGQRQDEFGTFEELKKNKTVHWENSKWDKSRVNNLDIKLFTDKNAVGHCKLG